MSRCLSLKQWHSSSNGYATHLTYQPSGRVPTHKADKEIQMWARAFSAVLALQIEALERGLNEEYWQE